MGLFLFSFWLVGFGFLGGGFGLTWAGDTVKNGPPQEKAWSALRVPPEVTRETDGSGATSASQPDPAEEPARGGTTRSALEAASTRGY